MNIRSTRIYHSEWMAVDDDTYDGAPDAKSPCGVGSSEQEARDDLLEKIEEAAARTSTILIRRLRAEDTEAPWCGDGGLFQCAADEIERLRAGLLSVKRFLSDPGWGTSQYMEGSTIYNDKDAAMFDVRCALGEIRAAKPRRSP